ncbi:MAG: hypothetical protein ACI8UO_005273 [Verrucomicrobiales bacterium]|jgi:hypothetical protein
MKLLIPIFFLLFAVLASAQEADESELLSFLRTNTKEVYDSVVMLRETDPADYQEALIEAAEAMASYENVRQHSKKGAAAYLKMFEIDYFAIGVADELVLSKDEKEQAELKAELTGMIERSFDQWVIYERARIEQLERAIKAAREKFDEEAATKESVVKQDMEQLLESTRAYQREKNRQEN